VENGGERLAVLDFIIEVEKTALPEWERIGRVLEADWGVHSLLSATAVDETGSHVGRPFFFEYRRLRWQAGASPPTN
jgi:putative transposase